MDVHIGTIKSVIDKVDCLVAYVERCDDCGAWLDMSDAESDALSLLPSLMDTLQRACDDNPPWRT